jgi:hypothetical protein
MCSLSAYPSEFEIPELVVATAGNPSSSTTRALATSHAFGNTRIGPWCRRRSFSAFSFCVIPRSSAAKTEGHLEGDLRRF